MNTEIITITKEGIMSLRKELAEPKCPSCNGFICKKIDQHARLPYQCLGCGQEFPTLPLISSPNPIWGIIEKFLHMKKEK